MICHTGCLKKITPLLSGNENKTVRYYYSPGGHNLSIFNLDSHTLHLRIVHQTPEIQACKVKICSAPQTRGFERGPSHDLYHGYFIFQSICLNFNFQFFAFVKNERLVDIILIENNENIVRMIKSYHISRMIPHVLLSLFHETWDGKQCTD